MRIWLSRSIRDVFKFEFPRNTVWNLHRIKIEKRMQHKFGICSGEGSLLNEGDEREVLVGDGDVNNRPSDSDTGSYVILDFLLRDSMAFLLLLLLFLLWRLNR